MPDSSTAIVLVLSGGNALGAYQAGGYEALHDAGLRPDWVVGASTGAINGAIIAGNAEADRVAKLRDYWQPGTSAPGPLGDWGVFEDFRRSAAATLALAAGRANLFMPNLTAAWPWGGEGPSLFDTHPLDATLARLVDFDLFNGDSGPRFTATAVDLETGEPVAFDTAADRIESRHIRASGALLPAFAPVEIDGRLLGDGGLAANLPVEVVLANPPARPTLCLALDLLPLAAPRPRTLGEAASRMQDLLFASQSRLALDGWTARYAAHAADAAPVTLLHLAYAAQGAEVAGKAFDFSPTSVRRRWDAGYADVAAALALFAGGGIATGPGLTVWRPEPAAAR